MWKRPVCGIHLGCTRKRTAMTGSKLNKCRICNPSTRFIRDISAEWRDYNGRNRSPSSCPPSSTEISLLAAASIRDRIFQSRATLHVPEYIRVSRKLVCIHVAARSAGTRYRHLVHPPVPRGSPDLRLPSPPPPPPRSLSVALRLTRGEDLSKVVGAGEDCARGNATSVSGFGRYVGRHEHSSGFVDGRLSHLSLSLSLPLSAC